MSVIEAIYTAIASERVSVHGVCPVAYTGSTLPNTVESARLPCRLLVPTGSRLGQGSYQRGTMGPRGIATIDWTLTDMVLWRSVSAGQGLRDIAGTLVAYCGAYAEMTRLLGGPGWTVTGLGMTAQIIEWPQGGDRWYDGVVCTLTITEILQG